MESRCCSPVEQTVSRQLRILICRPGFYAISKTSPYPRAEITVFLSFLLLLMLSFATGLCQVCLLQTEKSTARINADHALYSVFAGYDRALFDRYHLLSLAGRSNTPDTDIPADMALFDVSGTEHTVSGLQLLTDFSGAPYFEQAIAYISGRYGISAAARLTGMQGTWEEKQLQAEASEEAYRQTKPLPDPPKNPHPTDRNDEMNSVGDETGSETPDDATGKTNSHSGNQTDARDTQSNPEAEKKKTELKTANDLLHITGLSSYIFPAGAPLQDGRITDPSQLLSKKTLAKGYGTFPVKKSSAVDKGLFVSYLNTHFSCLTDQTGADPSDPLHYQLEYILYQKQSDQKNLEAVLWRLLFIRLALNLASLHKDTIRLQEAQAYALATSSLLLIPEATDAVKEGLVVAWAIGESIIDLRSLADGHKLPMSKSHEQWHLPLAGIFTLQTSVGTDRGPAGQSGLSYQDYLTGLLFLRAKEKLIKSSLDLIDLCMGASGHPHRPDQYITKIRLQSTAVIGGIYPYSFETYFGYRAL